MTKSKFPPVSKLSLSIITIVFFTISLVSHSETISTTPGGQKTVVKFMESLARYVTWPDSSFSGSESPFKYCLVGDTAIATPLTEKLSRKKVKKRAFVIKLLTFADVEQVKDCHLVYIAASDVPQLRSTIAALDGLAILTTGDFKPFAAHGGMVGFVGAGSKGSLQINKKRLEGSGLKASSKLYRVSTL